MSRFYKALKEASRLQPDSNPIPFAAETSVSGGNASAFVEAGVADPAPVLENLELPGRLSSQLKSTSEALKTAAAALFGSRTDIVLDQKARLIPHAIDGIVVEHYRRLRTKLLQHHSEHPFKTLLVTSPGPQEGKTVTALNLALSFAMLPNFKVLVVDGDLRRGSLGQWIQVEEHAGLSDLVEGTAALEDVVLKSDDLAAHFMVRGNSKMAPAELLQSPKLGTHFQRMAEHFDLVIVDSPPVNLVTDAQLLAAQCDAVLLIARAYSTTRKSLEGAVRDLSPFRLVGTVLNGGSRAQLYAGRKNGYYS